MLKIIKNFFNGLVLGMTQIVPGLSGGTVAIIMGFYFELISAINNFRKNIKKNLAFLLPFIIGMVLGLLLLGSITKYLLDEFSFPTMLFFIGLIFGIIPHVYTKVKQKGSRFKLMEIILIVIPFVLLLALSFFKKGESAANPQEMINSMTIPYMVFLFFAGVIAAAALIVPGFSGSFVLLMLGILPLALHTIDLIRIFLTDMSNTAILLDICKVLIPLGLGLIIGILLMAKLIEKLLFNYEKMVYAAILGLLLGSIYPLFMDPIVYQSGISAGMISIGIGTFLLGSGLAYLSGRKRL